MHVSQLRESKYLKKEEVGSGLVLTIAEVREQNIAKEGEAEDIKWLMFFNEVEKPLVLNSTNGQIIAQLTGSEESDGWIGHQIELYHDPSISFAGKLVGGIRVRAVGAKAAPVKKAVPTKSHGMLGKPAARPQPAPQAAPRPVQPNGPVDDEDVPF